MFFAPFYELFPELAPRETRSVTIKNDPSLPDGEYGLIEAYCNEPGCDCRRVMFNIFTSDSKVTPMMLLLDNTVLSNCALVSRIELLTIALGSQVATTPQVVDEFNGGVARGRVPETRLDWLEIINLEGKEETVFQELLMRVNAGEAVCLAVASERNGRILTDDRDARKLAAQLKVPVSSTLGILLRLVQIDVLTLTDANEILGRMIRKGYRSPVQKFEEL